MKKKKMYIAIVVAVLLVSISSLSYALWSSQFTQSNNNIVSAGCFSVSLTNGGSTISYSNSYPIADTAGKVLDKYYTFSIENTCNIGGSYELYFNINSSSTLASKFVKMYLEETDSSYNTVSSVALEPTIASGLQQYNNNASSRILSTGYLPASGKSGYRKYYKLRIWMDGAAPSSEGGKTFSGTISLNAVATSERNQLATLPNRYMRSTDPFNGKDNFDTYYVAKSVYTTNYCDTSSDYCSEYQLPNYIYVNGESTSIDSNSWQLSNIAGYAADDYFIIQDGYLKVWKYGDGVMSLSVQATSGTTYHFKFESYYPYVDLTNVSHHYDSGFVVGGDLYLDGLYDEVVNSQYNYVSLYSTSDYNTNYCDGQFASCGISSISQDRTSARVYAYEEGTTLAPGTYELCVTIDVDYSACSTFTVN